MSKFVKKKDAPDKETLDVQVPVHPLAEPVAKLDVPFEAKVAEEYQVKYGWIGKGNIDDTLKAILKELVRIRMGGGHV